MLLFTEQMSVVHWLLYRAAALLQGSWTCCGEQEQYNFSLKNSPLHPDHPVSVVAPVAVIFVKLASEMQISFLFVTFPFLN